MRLTFTRDNKLSKSRGGDGLHEKCVTRAEALCPGPFGAHPKQHQHHQNRLVDHYDCKYKHRHGTNLSLFALMVGGGLYSAVV